MIYRTKDGDILDAICWKYYGQQVGTVEAVLEANPRLADADAELPAGILISLPELSLSESEVITLW